MPPQGNNHIALTPPANDARQISIGSRMPLRRRAEARVKKGDAGYGSREIVAPLIEAELLRRGADGNWPEQPEIISADGTLSLASIAFTVPLAALYTALAGEP